MSWISSSDGSGLGLRPELKQAFAALSSSERTLAANLDKIGARNERSALRGAVEAFAAIRALLEGDVGIIATVRRNIEMKEKCERMSASLMDIAANESVRESQAAVSEANRFEAEMARIATAAVEIEQMLQLIATAIEEQNSTIAVINENVNALNDIAVQNATASEQMSSNMAELTRIADETGDRVAHFRL